MITTIKMVVCGVPGGGKTRFLVDEIRKYYTRDDAGRIAFTSFTRAAVDEARTRVAEKFGIPASDAEEDLPGFRTMHSHCFRALGLRKYMVVDEQDKLSFCEDILGIPYQRSPSRTGHSLSIVDFDAWMPQPDFETLGGTLFTAYEWCRCRRWIVAKRWRELSIPIEWRIEFSDGLVNRFVHEWQKYKTIGWSLHSNNDQRKKAKFRGTLIDFSDMIENVLAKKITLPFSDWFFDEFQDFNRSLYDVFRFWTGQPQVERVIIAGDPNQSIYGFGGGNPSFFMAEFNSATERVKLFRTFRCPEKIVRIANALITRIPCNERPDYLLRATEDSGTVGVISSDDVARIAYEKATAGGSVFVLFRTNFQLQRFARKLAVEGVPAQLIHDPDGFFNLLWSKTGPWMASVPPFLKAAGLISGSQELQPTDVKAILRFASFGTEPEFIFRQGEEKTLQAFTFSAETGQSISTEKLLNYAWHRTPEEFLDALQLRLSRSRQLDVLGCGAALLRALKSKRFDLPYPPDKLLLGTVHGVKGMQADCVILFVHTPAALRENPMNLNLLHDEIRLSYVAVTRARNALFLVDPEKFPPLKVAMDTAAIR